MYEATIGHMTYDEVRDIISNKYTTDNNRLLIQFSFKENEVYECIVQESLLDVKFNPERLYRLNLDTIKNYIAEYLLTEDIKVKENEQNEKHIWFEKTRDNFILKFRYEENLK